jgi:hypothetical protein
MDTLRDLLVLDFKLADTDEGSTVNPDGTLNVAVTVADEHE